MGSQKFKLGDVVEVIWHDTNNSDEEFNLDESVNIDFQICKRKAIGYFITENNDYFVICGDIMMEFKDMDKPYSFPTSFPQGMIDEVRKLK